MLERLIRRGIGDFVESVAKPELYRAKQKFAPISYALAEQVDAFSILDLTTEEDKNFFAERLAIHLFDLIYPFDSEAPPIFGDNIDAYILWDYFRSRHTLDQTLSKSDPLNQRGFKRALDRAAQVTLDAIVEHGERRHYKRTSFPEDILNLLRNANVNKEPKFNKRYLPTPENIRERLQEAKAHLDMFRPSPASIRPS